MTKRAINKRPNNLMSAILLGGALVLAACAETVPPAPKTCGDLLSDEAVQEEFAQYWRGRLAEAEAADSDEAPLGTEERDGMIDMFVLVTQGYCQADTGQPIPYPAPHPGGQEDTFEPTSARAALWEFVEWMQRSDE